MGSCCPGARVKTLPSEVHSPLSEFKFIHHRNIQQFYSFQEVIGSGYFGSVRLASYLDGSDCFAVKSIAKERIASPLAVKGELSVLHTVDHPNILRLYEIYEDSRYIHLVTEYCSGGDLFTRVLEAGQYSEAQACALMKKLLHAVSHLHTHGFTHRDIKPENLLFSHSSSDAEIKLVDFGLSTKFRTDEELHSLVGSPYYVAPEVLQKHYGAECDLWSLGVVMYFLLFGEPPFLGKSRRHVYRQILRSEYKLPRLISSAAEDLLAKLLTKNPAERISARAALSHPWLSQCPHPSQKNEAKILRRMSRNMKGGLLRNDVLKVVTRMMNPAELEQLNAVFREIDVKGTGELTVDDLQTALEKCGLELKQSVSELVRSFSTKDDKIHYSNFLTAAMNRRVLLNKEVRWMTFKFFDVEDKGYITTKSMREALTKLEIEVTEEEVLELLHEAGLKYESWIDYEEFCKILEPYPDDISSRSASIHIDSFEA